MSQIDRENLLEDEVIRPFPDGIRPFSVGIWRLCDKLGIDLNGGGKLGWSKIAWLMDRKNSLAEICAVEEGEEFDATIAAYEFAISPAFLAAVKNEFETTVNAVKLAKVKIEPKPDDPPARVPEKKS